MNAEKMDAWGKAKLILEVLAIIGAAAFAIFTWGIDSWRLSSPNWAVSYGKVNEFTAVVEGDRIRVCSDSACKEANACVIQSTIKTQNKAKTPLQVGNTKVQFYTYSKQAANGFVNQSSFTAYEKICQEGETGAQCPVFLGEVNIGPVDDQPLYPTHETWRPFRVEIVPSKLDGNPSFEEFSTDSAVLIVASQQVKPKAFFWEEAEKTSKATMVLHNLCLKGNFKTDEKDKESENPSS